MTNLSGKTLFITGASRGIGLAIALRAARDGANVTIAAKTTDVHPNDPQRGRGDRGSGRSRAGLPGRRPRRAPDRGRGRAHR
jgi:NAD(P)-dependent dehydrogenase (short-subunit alcohol dehydrogenase family)